MLTRKMLIALGLLFLAWIAACAPAPQDASKARSRDVIQQGGIVPAEELRVAEYLQYYKQNFPAPTNSMLGLDLRLGNAQIPADGGPAWLQIGIAARSAAAEDIAPLNLALVIDRSGSMDSPEKMPYLKQSLRVFLRSLASNDIIALVAFSTDAQVIQSASKVGDGSWIEQAIGRLEPGGSTNLYAGMMLGFQETSRNYDVRRNNRVILLTDGIANVGTTDPDQIAAAARSYNDRGIYLSTIGLGHDFNDKLLSQLAIQGKGGYHFIDSAEEMDKVFRQEVSGLMQKAAANVSVVIRPEAGVRVDGLTGYDGQPPSGSLQVRLQDMGTGDMQVVLANLYVGGGSSGRRPIATVELHYQDLFSQRDQVITQSIAADASRLSTYDATWDVEVLRNVTIQRTAEGLKEIDRLYKSQRYQEAWQLAYRLEQDLRTVARLTNEAQMVKDADMMRKYEDTLSQWVQRQTGRAPQPSRGTLSDQPLAPEPRSRQLLPTPTPPMIEIR
jgi:Ca-activated chloride channel family protein